MKQYNIKAITNNDELKLIFECDKDKNIECNKRYCGTCNHTTDTKYMKAKQRNKRLTDKELVVSLENEIEYYRHKINLLEDVHRENVECINKQDELIKEYQEIFKEILINKKDIFNIKTPNQVRRLLGYEEIQYDYDFNKEISNKQSIESLKNKTEGKLDSNIKEIMETNVYADEKVIKTIIEYKYNEEAE